MLARLMKPQDEIVHDPAISGSLCCSSYQLFRENPSHPSLQFKKIDQPNIYSVRVGLGYRAIGALEGSDIVWFWIGSHSEYDRLV
jgi:hypothetical protein